MLLVKIKETRKPKTETLEVVVRATILGHGL